MVRLLIQIYEIQTPIEAAEVLELGVDHVGSVVLPQVGWKNPRLAKTITLVQEAGRKSSLIPIVTETDAVLRIMDYYHPDILHLCDALPLAPVGPETCDQLIERQICVKEHFPEVKLMRSIPVAPAGAAERVPTLELGRRFEAASDFFLIDTFLLAEPGPVEGTQPVSGFVGITGRTCDWEMAARLVGQSNIPVLVAGGLGPENAEAAIARTRAAGVDSCTQTNLRDRQGRPVRFRKDLSRVKLFVEAVRRAEAQID